MDLFCVNVFVYKSGLPKCLFVFSVPSTLPPNVYILQRCVVSYVGITFKLACKPLPHGRRKAIADVDTSR